MFFPTPLLPQGNIVLTDSKYEVLTLLRSHRDDAKGLVIMARHPYPMAAVRLAARVTPQQLDGAAPGADSYRGERWKQSCTAPCALCISSTAQYCTGCERVQRCPGRTATGVSGGNSTAPCALCLSSTALSRTVLYSTAQGARACGGARGGQLQG